MSETLYRKYRPKTFADVTGQEHVTGTILNQLKQGAVAHAYLFAGPRGVGKTTIARLLAKAVNCEHMKDGEPCLECSACKDIASGAQMDVYEIDAASHTGVDNVRENVIENVRFAPVKFPRKVFIIDEAHMLSTPAFNALLKTLEEPPAHALFVLATTEIHKVPETIISRCQRFDFHRIPHDLMIERLKLILKQEKITVDEEVLEVIVIRSEGCLRDAESLLNQVLAIGDGNHITKEEASLVLPDTNINEILTYLQALKSGSAKDAVQVLHAAMDQGVRFDAFHDEMVEILRYALLQSLCDFALEKRFDGQSESRIREFSEHFGTNGIREILTSFLEYKSLFKNDKIPQLPLEMLAIRLCEASNFPPAGGGIKGGGRSKTEDLEVPPKPPSVGKNQLTTTKSVAGLTKIAEDSSKDNSQGTVALETIKKKWDECCDEMKKKSATLPMILKGADVVGVNANIVRLKVAFPFMADQLNEQKNKHLVEEVLRMVFERTLTVEADAKEIEGREEVVDDLLAEFGGKVIE